MSIDVTALRPQHKEVKRKVIQLTQTNPGPLLALCNDGTMWYANTIDNDTIEWEILPQIPQEIK